MAALQQRMTGALAGRKARNILRRLTHADEAPSTPLVDFSSNDYLSFSKSPHLRKRLLDSLAQSPASPLGPSSARLLDGNTPLHCRLEDRLASFFSGASALLFNSGFDANVGIWSTLPGPGDWVLYDEFIHASTHDGMRASRCAEGNRVAFKHNSVAGLRRELQEIIATDEGVKNGTANVFVAVETLYSMDGDICPLTDMVKAMEELLPLRNGHLVVDEAHSTGIWGPDGKGLACGLSLAPKILVRLHTFGKAAACSGAVVLCPPLVREYLLNYARPFIYSTVMTRMNVLAISATIDEFETTRRQRASERLHYLSSTLLSLLRDAFAELPTEGASVFLPPDLLEPSASPFLSPIIPILTPNPRSLSAFLAMEGFLLRPISYPTVPKGAERVRACLHAGNTEAEITGLVKSIQKWVLAEGQMEREKLACPRL